MKEELKSLEKNKTWWDLTELPEGASVATIPRTIRMVVSFTTGEKTSVQYLNHSLRLRAWKSDFL